jgi:hypothetical protein
MDMMDVHRPTGRAQVFPVRGRIARCVGAIAGQRRADAAVL